MTKPKTEARLNVQTLPLADLKPHPRNPRTHPAPGSPEWESLKRSLASDYFDPIVTNRRNGLLVSGHLRTKVLIEAGFKTADCVVVDYDEPTHIARMMAANKSIGRDDMAALKDLLQELDTGATDMSLTGFTESELETLMTQFHVEPDGDPGDGSEGKQPGNPRSVITFPPRVWLTQRKAIIAELWKIVESYGGQAEWAE